MFDDPLAAVEAAIAGGGVSLTLRSLVETELVSGQLVELRPTTSDIRLDHYLVVPQDRLDRPAVGQLVDWLKQQASSPLVAPRPDPQH